MADRGGRTRLYRADAVVLRRRDLGEADRILTVFTREHGKLRVVAKGARRTKSRLAGHLEPFARSSLLLAEGRNLDIVTQASLVQPFKRLRDDELRIAYAGYFADLLDALSADEEAHPAVYEVLIAALERLDEGSDAATTTVFFELGLLRLLGFRPELHQCITCGRVLDPVVNGFTPVGGVLCPECRPHDPLSAPLSVNALKLLRLLDRAELATVDSLRLPPALKGEVQDHLRVYVRHLLERDLASLSVLKTLAT